MNNKLPPRWLMVGLMMFPQIVETIYSPVLTHIASQFQVSEGQASQTLSVYFLAFAVGLPPSARRILNGVLAEEKMTQRIVTNSSALVG